MKDNEQWKSDGDCKACRRKNYCGKGCKAHERYIERGVRSIIAKTLLKEIYKK